MQKKEAIKRCKRCNRIIRSKYSYCQSNLFCAELYRKEWEAKRDANTKRAG